MFFCQGLLNAQKIYPSHWWTGMKNSSVQLMIYDKDANLQQPGLKFSSSSPEVLVKKVHKTENLHYLFVDIEITKNAKPQQLNFTLQGSGTSSRRIPYELKAKSAGDGKTRIQGITSADFVYLMIPDRFSNGDPSNDTIAEYRERANDRKNKFTRHGGDFKGITNHLDYLSDLGVTALWLTPVIENNTALMHEFGNDVAGYHGYWFTDHYQVDKRLGGNEGYRQFVNDVHKKGLKVIQDAVYNHVSKQHWFILDLPMKDWINNWPEFTSPNHREETLFDPNVSDFDKKKMLDGWFVDHLPDLNQRNPFVAKFLIQHAVWTTEEFGIDGWRVDTYKYCDEQFMNDVNSALLKEFPAINIFGEAVANSVPANAYFTKNNMVARFNHNEPGILDFQVCYALLAGMNEKFGWTNGVTRIYMTLAQDLLYKNPMNNCSFLDNHDMDRVFSVVDEDWTKLKMGLNWLFTIRGLPQLYYGTEVLMKNRKTNTDAVVREDFPGGWKDDQVNKFTAAGRTEQENSAFNHVSKLAKFRKNSSAIVHGKTTQFIPQNGVYVYFRYDNKQTVMVISNTGENTVKPNWADFAERAKGFNQLRDVVTAKSYNINEFEIKPKESYVFELLR